MTQGKLWSVFLGGHDLEMFEIGRLLATRNDIEVHDQRLAWGATASVYLSEIRAAIQRGHRVAIIELPDDLPADIPRDHIDWIDHHGALAGANRPTSIEQIFHVMEFPPQRWNRDLMLVAANDRGHIRGLQNAGATPEEILDIRTRDRAAQGITLHEEEQGRNAANRTEAHFGGRLLAVRLPHTRTATVTDILADAENLIVFCPGQTVFFGSGRCIDALRVAYPEGWFGGELPVRGYWGVGRALIIADVVQLLETPIVTLPSDQIDVKAFHHILLWPLLMREGGIDHNGNIDPFVKAFESAGWAEVVGSSNGVHSDYSYPEVVYFHPFVRAFLFGDGKNPNRETPLEAFQTNGFDRSCAGHPSGRQETGHEVSNPSAS